jgi:hypothetical protein
MKRSSCLSAMLVGLSVVTASVAFAAPPAEGMTGTQVAKAKGQPPTTVQPSDPTPSGGGSDPTAAPTTPAPSEEPAAAPSVTPPGAAVTNTAPPGADTPPTAPEEPTPKAKPRPWAGTNVANYNSMSTGTLFKGQQQSYDPTVESAIVLLPRYTINDSFQLRGRLGFAYEYTNSDTTVTKNEPRFGDSTVQLFYRKIPEIPGGIKPQIALNLTAPTSPESRARTMVVSPGATLQLSKVFEHVIGGDVTLISNLVYSHPLYRSTTPELRTSLPYQPRCVGGNSCADQLSGAMNPSDTFSYSLIVVGEWGKWAPGVAYFGTSSWAYHPTEAKNPVDGTPLTSPDGFRPQTVRQTSYFSFWLDYEVNSWLTPEIGYTISRSVLDEAGQRGNPFFDRYQDMRVYLGANIAIDNILKALEGGPAEAGVVRAQNQKSPIVRF